MDTLNTYYVYSGGEIITEYDDSCALKWNYVYGLGQRLARYKGTDRQVYHNDHLGSVRALTRQNGSPVSGIDYYPNGEKLGMSGTNERFSFTGKEYVEEYGFNLYYYGARFMDPVLGPTVWGPERRLTDQTDIFTARAISVGDTLLCSYASITGIHAYFIRSSDAGATWGDYIALGDSQPLLAYDFPEMARDDNNIILGSSIWNFNQMGSNLGYFQSSDLGLTWGPMRTVFSFYRDHQSNYSSLTNSGRRLYFAWNEYDRDSLYVLISTDWGESWNGRGINVAYLNGTPQNMCLRASGNYLHLVWVNEEGTINVRYSRSTDSGRTWSAEIDVAQDPRGAQRCQVAVQDNHVAISWMGYQYITHLFPVLPESLQLCTATTRDRTSNRDVRPPGTLWSY